MVDEMKKRIEILESQNELLGNKINEILSCLDENEIYPKTSIDYLTQVEDEIDVDDGEEEELEKVEKTKVENSY